MKSIYLIGSLRNPEIPRIAASLRAVGHDVFDDWYAAGEFADETWRTYELERGRTYAEALAGYHASQVFEFDLFHLNRCDVGVLVLPAGKSGHLELGYLVGCCKPAYILLDNVERFDVMYKFGTVIPTVDKLVEVLT